MRFTLNSLISNTLLSWNKYLMCLYILICATNIWDRMFLRRVSAQSLFYFMDGYFRGHKILQGGHEPFLYVLQLLRCKGISIWNSCWQGLEFFVFPSASFSYLTSPLCTSRQGQVDVFATRWSLVSFSRPPFRAKRRKDIGESYVRRKTVVVFRESKEKNCPSSLLSELWQKVGGEIQLCCLIYIRGRTSHFIKLAELSCSDNNASFLVTERCQWDNTD